MRQIESITLQYKDFLNCVLCYSGKQFYYQQRVSCSSGQLYLLEPGRPKHLRYDENRELLIPNFLSQQREVGVPVQIGFGVGTGVGTGVGDEPRLRR